MLSFLNGGALRHRALRAGAWTIAGHGGTQALRLASNLVMTRLLVPEAFGLMAVVNAIYFVLHMLSDFGIQAVIIQHRRGEDPVFLNTAWLFQIARGAVLATLGLLLALAIYWAQGGGLVPASSVYADPALPLVLAMVSAVALMQGFSSVHAYAFQRQLRLGRYTLLEIGAQTAAIAVMISWALVDASVYALVAGGIVAALVSTVSSHLFFGRPRLSEGFDPSLFGMFFHTGKWILLSSTATAIVNRGDRIILGLFIPGGLLGIYSIAALMTEVLQAVTQRLVSAVAYPSFSEVMRERPERFRSAYYRFRTPVDIVMFSGAGLLFSWAEDIIAILYDDRFSEAGWMLKWLMVLVVLQVWETAHKALTSAGEFRNSALIRAVQAACVLIGLPLAFRLGGMEAAVLTYAFHPLVPIVMLLNASRRHGWMVLWKEVRFLPLIGLGIATGIALKLIVSLFLQNPLS